MAHRLEIMLKPELADAEGNALCKKAKSYLGIELESVRSISILTIDGDLSGSQLESIRSEIFTNPVTQTSSYDPIAVPFDFMLWVGFRPGVRDNPGATAVEAVQDFLGVSLSAGESVYTSKRYALSGKGLDAEKVDRIARELLANDIIQQWRVWDAGSWDPATGVGMMVPKVKLDHTPTVATIPIDSDEALLAVSKTRNLALNPNDVPVIRSYFNDEDVRRQRNAVGLGDPTDVELEYVSQARSDHCNHNTFRGLFRYREGEGGPSETIDNLFRTCIEKPTLALKEEKDWVVSVLWDNAGAGRFDEDHYYVITGETHNSPSNMEAYGGAITGIVGVYRDPMGTGKGARLIMGSYGYCVGPRDYDGELQPHLHPRRLLDGVIEGVRDGGNKSGIPTTFGQTLFHPGYIGKCLVFVTAVGIMPARIAGEPSDEKRTSPGDRIVMCGGRVGKDGIHGVTASSESFSEHTPAGHVQIGDPYTQKKMHDFLLEARDQGLIRFITDNGGGGLSSSIGESARFSNGCEVDLERVPLKYEGLDPWEIWVSESQERMTVAVHPDDLETFMELARKHEVESTVIGRYTDSGKLHIRFRGETCAYVDLDFLTKGFPQWEFDAVWRSPSARGLEEPVIQAPTDCGTLLLDLLARPNICSKEWIARQYDHEVQGGSVIKPLTGKNRDVPADAAVIRPVLGSGMGLAFAQALHPAYSAIDAYQMAASSIDEAVRRVVAVGGDLDHIGGVDNFCWPNIQHDESGNPDGDYKAAQLIRACKAIRDVCLAYKIPLLSGKDSMYVDGHLRGRYGIVHKVSAPETLQFSTISAVPDISRCQTLDFKAPGDLLYVLGETRNELGGSEYYEHLGYVGRNVPEVMAERFLALYRRLGQAVSRGLVASVHGIYRGGLGVHLALCCMAGRMGANIRAADIPTSGLDRFDKVLFSESQGRFIVSIDPRHSPAFEELMAGQVFGRIGEVVGSPELSFRADGEKALLTVGLPEMERAWKAPFGDLI
jgi:phosphoribosylformylglycinamidine synthase